MRPFRRWMSWMVVLGVSGLAWVSEAAPTYYTLSDFQWYVHHADGSKRRTELLSQLSRRQIMVGILWSDAAERRRKLQEVQAFWQRPPAVLPPLREVKPGPSGNHFATYVMTTAEDLSLAGVAVLLNNMQAVAAFDYALPVLHLSRGPVAPFIEFRAVFSPRIEASAIASFLQRQPVTVLSHHGLTYTLRLHTHATTNILMVIRTFEEATRLVTEVQPVWLDVRISPSVNRSTPVLQSQPVGEVPVSSPAIEAHIRLDTGWNFPLVEARQPVTYQLLIDHRPQLHILPESIASSALRRALVRATALPPELFEVSPAAKHTESLSDQRIRERVTYTIRLSKPGTYRIPALQIAYSAHASRRRVRQVQSLPSRGYLLTVDAHLPADTRLLPGDILTPPRPSRYPWPWLQYLGGGMLAGGVALLVGLLCRAPYQRPPPRPNPLSLQQIRQQYQNAWQPLRAQTPATTGSLSPEARVWLRAGAALIRRLLGTLAAGEPALFTGAAGASTATITAHLQGQGQSPAVLAPALQLLEELDALATAPAPTLRAEDYQRHSEAVQHTIEVLTTQEVSRVLRASFGS